MLVNLTIEKSNNRKKEECSVLLDLDFSLACSSSEAFSTMLKEPDCKFSLLAGLVCSSSHLPSLLRSAYFFSTFRAFSHTITVEPI